MFSKLIEASAAVWRSAEDGVGNIGVMLTLESMSWFHRFSHKQVSWPLLGKHIIWVDENGHILKCVCMLSYISIHCMVHDWWFWEPVFRTQIVIYTYMMKTCGRSCAKEGNQVRGTWSCFLDLPSICLWFWAKKFSLASALSLVKLEYS